MTTPIKPLPDSQFILPETLVRAVRRRACILFVGPDFTSEIANTNAYPSTRELGYHIAQELYRVGYISEVPKRDQDFNLFSLAESYKLLFGRRELLAIADQVLNDYQGIERTETYRFIIKSFPVIITTNYDVLFERAAVLQGKNPLTLRPGDSIVLPTSKRQSTIIKLRGDLEDPEHIILTREDEFRTDNSKKIWQEVRSLLSRKQVIFAGLHPTGNDLNEVYFNLINGNNLKGLFIIPLHQGISSTPNQWDLLRKRFERNGINFRHGPLNDFLHTLETDLKRAQEISYSISSDKEPVAVKTELTSNVRRAKDLIKDYKNNLFNQLGVVNTINSEDVLTLDKIFIDINLIEEYPSQSSLRRLNKTTRIKIQDELDLNIHYENEIKEFADDKLGLNESSVFQRALSASELPLYKGPILLLGDPGSGKTTLLKYLTLQSLKDPYRLPVFLSLNTVTQELIDKSNSDLVDLLFDTVITESLQMSAAERRQFKQSYLSKLLRGAVSIFIDGLDEVNDVDLQSSIILMLRKFVSSNYRNNYLAISSRDITLHAQFSDIQILRFMPLNDYQIEGFLKRYFSNGQTAKRLSHLIQGHSQLHELAKVPLFLAAIGYIYYSSLNVPTYPLDIIRDIVRYFVTVLDERKRVESFNITDRGGQLKLNFLKFLAFECSFKGEENKKTDTYMMTSDFILDKTRQFIPSEINSLLFSADIKASPILKEVRPGVFSFAHIVLQNYLAAWELSGRNDKETIICRSYFNPNLEELEILPMAFGLSTDSNELYTVVNQLPDSLNFTNIRLRARGLTYLKELAQEHLKTFSDDLMNLITARKDSFEDSHPFSDEIFRSLATANVIFKDYIVDQLLISLDAPQIRIRSRSNYRGPIIRALGKIGGERALKYLLNALNERGNALDEEIEAAGELRDVRAVKPLSELLLQGDRAWESAVALSKIGGRQAEQILLSALQSPNKSARQAAALALCKFSGSSVITPLVKALNDTNELVRWFAADALGQIGDKRAIDGLIKATEGYDHQLSWHATQALGDIGGERARSALSRAIISQVNLTRWGAALALATYRDPRAIKPLFEMLRQEEDPLIRYPAARALVKISGDRVVRGLIDILKEQDSRWSLPTTEALAKLNDPHGNMFLLDALNSSNKLLKLSAAFALGEVKNAKAKDVLLEVLESDYEENWRAAIALGNIGEDRAVGALLLALQSKDRYVRIKAAETLQGLSREVLIDGLLKALSHKNSIVRQRAAEVVVFYSSGEKVLEELSRLSHDPTTNVRNAAHEARSRLYFKLRYIEEDLATLAVAESVGRERTLEETRAYIAHEVKSAIGPLRFVAQLLDERIKQLDFTDADITEYIERILKGTDIAYDVVNRFVDYTKPLSPQLLPIDLNTVVIESIDEVAAECDQKNISINKNLGEISEVAADRGLIGQAIRNVLRNAIEAIGRDGELRIITKQDNGKVIINISDTGQGIKPEQMNQIFELGFTTKLGKRGAGLGLPLVRRIVEEGHEGHVSIANNLNSPGAIVSIELPIVRRPLNDDQ